MNAAVIIPTPTLSCHIVNPTLDHSESGTQPIHIPTNSSLPMPPSPRISNSSIIARNSSSCSPSPSSCATRLRSASSILPLPSASNRSNARRISSRGSRAKIRCAATLKNAAWLSSNREGPEKVGCEGTGALEFVAEAESEEAGTPCVWRMFRISDLGRSKPRALSATLSSW